MTNGLEQVLEQYLRAAEGGAAPSRESLLAAHPDLAKELGEFLDGQDFLRSWVKSARAVTSPDRLPCTFGSHRLLEEIGRGGMGVVYKAQSAGLDRHVALKVVRSARFASPAELARFKLEAEAASGLDHPNIVPIYGFGEHEGQPYYTMKLVEGGSLQERLPAYREDPRAAARVMAEVARAVRYAHRRAILHRDLKPANILIDAEGRPHVTDFGLAKRMDGADEASGSGEIVGTLAYMAPEQASGRKTRLSVSVDIHGMGAVLYALLTGQSPFEGGSSMELLRKIQEQEPADPRALNPRVDADLAAICLMCLQKDPAKRYEIASDLAEDLESWLEGRPVRARHVGRVVRFWRWSRRHAMQLTLASTAAALVGVVSLPPLAKMRATSRRQGVLEENARKAVVAAGRILERVNLWARHVREAADQEGLRELLRAWDRSEAGAGEKIQSFCRKLHHQQKDPAVLNWHILDWKGIMVARTPEPRPDRKVIGEDFSERDYFKGTRDNHQGGESIHLSKVYLSVADDKYKFNLCARVVDPEGRLLGVIGTAITTDPTMGLSDLHDNERRTVLVAPWDTDRRPKDPQIVGRPSDHLVLLHPTYSQGVPAGPFVVNIIPKGWHRVCGEELGAPKAAQESFSRIYKDPYYDDRPQLAGFAPVGNTGFVVIIQQEDK